MPQSVRDQRSGSGRHEQAKSGRPAVLKKPRSRPPSSHRCVVVCFCHTRSTPIELIVQLQHPGNTRQVSQKLVLFVLCDHSAQRHAPAVREHLDVPGARNQPAHRQRTRPTSTSSVTASDLVRAAISATTPWSR